MSAAPTISTERLNLRPYMMAHGPLYRDMRAGARRAYLGGSCEEVEAWRWFTSDLAQLELPGHGALHADRLSNRATVAQANRIRPPNWPQEEMRFWAYDGHVGKGYASDAAMALRDGDCTELPAPEGLQ